jgi:hypothetical protein
MAGDKLWSEKKLHLRHAQDSQGYLMERARSKHIVPNLMPPPRSLLFPTLNKNATMSQQVFPSEGLSSERTQSIPDTTQRNPKPVPNYQHHQIFHRKA